MKEKELPAITKLPPGYAFGYVPYQQAESEYEDIGKDVPDFETVKPE